MFLYSISPIRFFSTDLSSFKGNVPRGLEGVVNERRRFENLRLKQSRDPEGLNNAESQELIRLERAYRKLSDETRADLPFTDY